MWRKLDFAAAVILCVTGGIHTACTPVYFQALEEPALWFAGGGLAFIFLGALHLLRLQQTSRTGLWLIRAAGLLGTSYCALIAWKLPVPQAWGMLAICFFLLLRSARPDQSRQV